MADASLCYSVRGVMMLRLTSRHHSTASLALANASIRSPSLCWHSYPLCQASSRRQQSRYRTRAALATVGSAAYTAQSRVSVREKPPDWQQPAALQVH